MELCSSSHYPPKDRRAEQRMEFSAAMPVLSFNGRAPNRYENSVRMESVGRNQAFRDGVR